MPNRGLALLTFTTLLAFCGCKGDPAEDAAPGGTGGSSGAGSGTAGMGGSAAGRPGAEAGESGAGTEPATGGTRAGSGGSPSGTGGTGAAPAGSSVNLQGYLDKFVVAPNGDFIVSGSAVMLSPTRYQQLSRFGRDGQQIWSTTVPDSAGTWDPSVVFAAGVGVADVAVTADDEVFALGGSRNVTTDGMAERTQYLSKFDAGGTLLWKEPLPGDPQAGNAVGGAKLAVDSEGNAVVLVFNETAGSHLQRYSPDGKVLWDIDPHITDIAGGQPYGSAPEALAIDDAGDIYVRASVGTKGAAQKFSSDGDLLWQTERDAGVSIAVAPDGSRLYGIWTQWGDGTSAGINLEAFDGKKGTHEWTKTTMAATCTELEKCNVQAFGVGVAVVGGNAVISGVMQGVLPGQTDVTAGAGSIAMSFDPDGNVLWAHQFLMGYTSNVATGPEGAAFVYAGTGINGRIYDFSQ